MATDTPRTALVIAPHADDAAAFLGGTLVRFAAEGWRMVLVRVTDDARDSVGSTVEDTTRINAEQLRNAADILGVDAIEELGYPTDTLGDVSKVALRERFVYLFRKHRPYAVFSFDPTVPDPNLDHVVTAQCIEEAYWVSCFDLHHPEHFDEGLAPFSVCERWYFARELPSANRAIDITDYYDASVRALCAHDLMFRNVLNQYRLQARTWGKTIPPLEQAFHGDMQPLVSMFLAARAQAAAERHGLPEGRLAESSRLERFGDLEPLFQAAGEPLPGAPPPIHRKGLDP